MGGALANIRRRTRESTSAGVVARTGRVAQQRLRDANPPPQELSASELEALMDEPSHIPLTTRKKS